MSVDKKEDLILNSQEFQQGQLPNCDEESEEEETPRAKNGKGALNKNETKTGSKKKDVPIEDDRTSSSSEGSESSASYVAVEIDADESKSQRSLQKPVFQRNERGADFVTRRREQNPRGYLSSEKSMAVDKPKPYHENSRNYSQQQPYYQNRLPQNTQYYTPQPNSFTHPQAQFQPSPNYYPNQNNVYVNQPVVYSHHNMNHNAYYQAAHYPQPQQNSYNHQTSSYNSFNTPKYPQRTFQQQHYDSHSYKSSKHRVAYQQKSGIKTVINKILAEFPHKQEIIRLVLQLVVNNKNELALNRLGAHWTDKQTKTKVQKILKILKSNDLILKLNIQEQQAELERKKQLALSKRDPRKRE